MLSLTGFVATILLLVTQVVCIQFLFSVLLSSPYALTCLLLAASSLFPFLHNTLAP